MASAVIPDGRALARARKAKGLGQKALGLAITPRMHETTISRIERGAQKSVRPSTIRKLADVLGVRPVTLCKTTERASDLVRLRMDSNTNNALTLVAQRYGVSREQIVAIAPVLFFIAAEQSLQNRRKQVDELRARAVALIEMYQQIGHLPPTIPVDVATVEKEMKSIADRDILGKSLYNFEGDYDESLQQNPFVVFLRNMLAKVSDSSTAADELMWYPYHNPYYRICEEEARAIVGDDADAVLAILGGTADLQDLPEGSTAERAEWARTALEKSREDFLRTLEDPKDREDFFRDLDDGEAANAQAPTL